MTTEQAEEAATTLQAAGWDVVAQRSPLGNRDYELRGKAADGTGFLYGFSHNDMKVLVLGGQIARKTT